MNSSNWGSSSNWDMGNSMDGGSISSYNSMGGVSLMWRDGCEGSQRSLGQDE